MTTVHAATRTFALLGAMAAAWPVAAQTAALQPASAPPAWSVSSDQARRAVEIVATAKDGTSRLILGCDKSVEADLTATLTGYRGAGLRVDGAVEPLLFYASGEEWRDAFSIRLRYSAARRSWELAHPLSPIFLRSFSRGATLALVNASGQDVAVFDLTGSTAATRAMRTVCGLPD